MNLYFVDDICGSGKTTAMIKKLDGYKGDDKFIYCTPLLNEVVRVREALTINTAREPEESKDKEGNVVTKMRSVSALIKAKENVVTTHKLISSVLLSKHDLSNYTLVLDEVMELTTIYNMSGKDIDFCLNKGYIEICKDTGLISPINLSYILPVAQREFIALVKLKCLFKTKQGVVVLNISPVALKSCKRVIVMSYMVEGSYIYQALAKITNTKPIKLMVDNEMEGFNIWDRNKAKAKIREITKRITVVDDKHRDNVVDKVLNLCNLSYSATSNLNKVNVKKLSNTLKTYLDTHLNTTSDSLMISSFGNKIKARGYIKSYVPYNRRATNDYSHKSELVYLINKHQNPVLDQWITGTLGAKVDEDMYSLDCLIQWVFRSRIRNGEPIKLLIPSPKMKRIYDKWADGSIFDSKEEIS